MNHDIRRRLLLMGQAVVFAGLLGCNPGPKVDTREWLYVSPYNEPRSLAVTVFMNQSGSDALDTVVVTDEFYTELQQVPGLEVVPVNRVLAAMDELHMPAVRSPDDAVRLADHLDVDGVIVGAVTRYDPYWPPIMGMAVQLYGRVQPEKTEVAEEKPQPPPQPWDFSRMPTPFSLGDTHPLKPQAMVMRIYDAGRDDVIGRLKAYSRERGGDATPMQWRKQATRRNYLRFVAHEMIGELLAQENRRIHQP